MEQAIAVAVVLCAGAIAELEGVHAARVLVAAGLVVELVVVAVAGAHVSTRRDSVLEMISEGRGGLPLRAVERARRRLASAPHQLRLARWLDAMRHEAEQPVRVRPIYTRRVILAVAPELALLADHLRTGEARLRGVAATERLLVDGTSALYGPDERPLREELRRIRYLTECRPMIHDASPTDRAPST